MRTKEELLFSLGVPSSPARMGFPYRALFPRNQHHLLAHIYGDPLVATRQYLQYIRHLAPLCVLDMLLVRLDGSDKSMFPAK